MTGALRAACVQVTATPDRAAGIALAAELIRAAHADGAAFITLPENVVQLAPQAQMKADRCDEASHPALAVFCDLAAELGIWLLAGSLAVSSRDGKNANRSLLIDAKGIVTARYDKIHMFDVDLTGGERYRESDSYAPGDRAVLAGTPWGPLGMTICYDLRFPALYRALAQAGARLLSIPSAFTVPTGKAHWHVLLRARAIETGCFVFAPAQCGTHYGKRKTYGHSLIIDPWGEILAEGGTEPGVITADLDLARIDDARAMVPSLGHERAFKPPVQPLS